jgi:tripartite motif-containing protein 71
VVVFGLDGSFVRQWGTEGSGDGHFNGPLAVVVNGDEVFVTDIQHNRVQVFGLDGSFVRQWGGRGGGAGQFVCPEGIAVSEGEVFIASCHRIQVFK